GGTCRPSRATRPGRACATAARMPWQPRRHLMEHAMDDVLNAQAPGDVPPPHESAHAAGFEGAGRRRLEIWLPLAIVAVDQLSKAAIRATLPLHQSVTIVPGLMDFTHVRNTGAAFGILNLAEFPFKT